ncbi:TetR/AcrR family transcriptional regulator [Spirosoma luteolum]
MGEVMAERGTEKAGINAVAERADVNKVLIYRYFGGWNGLLEAYVQRGFFLSMFNEKFLESAPDNLAPEHRSKIWSEYTIQFMREFRNRKSSQELIRWEMTHGETELAQRLAAFRNESFKNLVSKIAPYSDYDPIAITSLMVAAVTHLVLVSGQQDTIMDIDLRTDAGWQRLETAIRRIYSGLNIALERESVKKMAEV